MSKVVYYIWLTLMITAVVGFGVIVSIYLEALGGFFIGCLTTYILAGLVAWITQQNRKGGREP